MLNQSRKETRKQRVNNADPVWMPLGRESLYIYLEAGDLKCLGDLLALLTFWLSRMSSISLRDTFPQTSILDVC